ncbi:MAG: AarF/UbiB family protein, partial [Acidobacteriota bacterium]
MAPKHRATGDANGPYGDAEYQLASLPRRPPEPLEEDQRAADWCARLHAAGPAFVAVGLYWSSRVDLLPASLRRALASLQEPRFWPTPISDAMRRLDEVAGHSASSFFNPVEGDPRTADLFTEGFCAELTPDPGFDDSERLPRGARVHVVFTRPQLDDAADALELLPRTGAVLRSWIVTQNPAAADELINDARRSILGALDLGQRAEALEALADDDTHVGWNEDWDTPRVYRNLSNDALLTVEALDIQPLEWVIGAFRESPEPAQEMAQRLCCAWLRQALLGPRVPSAPRVTHLAVSAAGRFSLSSGGFSRTSPKWQDRLTDYLNAVETHDPDTIL